MKPDVKKIWLKALRSGDYQQAEGVLRQFGRRRFCCLGVLLDVTNPKGWRTDAKGWGHGDYMGGRCEEQLDRPTRVSFGIDADDMRHLMGMNDGQDNFGKIANWIERNL